MDKFTKMIKEKGVKVDDTDNILYQEGPVKIVKFEDWSILVEKDAIVCIPYLIEQNKIIIRQEYVPTYKFLDDREMYITVLAGSIEESETPEQALIREVEEEAGIQVRPDFLVEFDSPLFMSKGIAAKYYCCILPLTEMDYEETIARGDGSKAEELSMSVKVDVKYINTIVPTDTITALMLMKIKDYLNIK